MKIKEVFFFERFNQKKFEELTGLQINFVQDNISISKKGVIRGLHMQKEPFAQAKLVSVLKGEVLDVVIDMREDSDTYKQVYSIVLSSENKKQLFISKGFLHGFSVLTDNTIFAYKCSNYYNKELEYGIRYDDPAFNIDWKVRDNFIISSKDDNLKNI